MKIGKNSPLPQFNDQEGTHFCKPCAIRGCNGMYRRTHENDMPVCDSEECGHVYRSGIKEAPHCIIKMITGKTLRKMQSSGLVERGITQILDVGSIIVLINPETRKTKPKAVSHGQWQKFVKRANKQ